MPPRLMTHPTNAVHHPHANFVLYSASYDRTIDSRACLFRRSLLLLSLAILVHCARSDSILRFCSARTSACVARPAQVSAA